MASNSADPRMAALSGPPVGELDKRIADVTEKLKQVGKAQDSQISADAPVGDFSKASLGRLTDIINSVFKVLGIDKVLTTPAGPAKAFDADLTSAVLMFSAMINDAIKENIIDAELLIDPKTIVSDGDIRSVIAKISTALAQKEFKRWLLSESPGPTDTAEDAAEGENPSTEEESPSGGASEDMTEKLFAQRA